MSAGALGMNGFINGYGMNFKQITPTSVGRRKTMENKNNICQQKEESKENMKCEGSFKEKNAYVSVLVEGEADTNTAVMIKVSKISVISNVALTVFKLAAGIIGRSSAMVADAVHSLSDVAGSALVIVGAKISGRNSDDDHPYGHERLECVVSLILANILLLVGAGIGYNGIKDLMDPSALAVPGALALAAAVVSLVAKEALFWYTRAAAKKINSVSLMAEAWHHRSDALSSIGSFVGILGAILGVSVLQPIACIIIAVMILKVAVGIYKDTFDRLVDRSAEEKTVEQLSRIAKNVNGVIDVDDIKTRLFGSKIYVDIEIACDSSLSLSSAHDIAENVHQAVERCRGDIKHCNVHVNPR